jgi:uncharacterized protein (TIGR02001 family)
MAMRLKLTQLCNLAIAMAMASTAVAQEGTYSVKANVGVHSQYVYRGLSQTNEHAAIQGGTDYTHSSGFYAGTWLSNVSWFSDTNAGTSNSLEIDLYTGFRKSWDNGLATDVGYLRYQYPGSYPSLPAGTVEPHTDEAYAAIGWKWATLKYSYAFSDLFGVEDSKGSDYLDLTITVPLNDQLLIIAHAGRQGLSGASTAARLAGTTNDALYSYDDYRASLNYAFAQGWSVLLTYTDTNARDAGYTVLGKNLGDDQVVLGVTRSF